MPNPFIHSMLRASPEYTQFPVSSLGSYKERAQPGVITEESPTTRSTRECCIQPYIKTMLRAQCREWILPLLLLLTDGQRVTCTQHRRTGKNQDAMCLLRSRSNSGWLSPTALVQHRSKEVESIFLPWHICCGRRNSAQLQLRACKNLKFSQVSFFLCCKKPNKPTKQNNSTTRPNANVTLPLYCSQAKTTWVDQRVPALEVSDLKCRRNTWGGELIKHTCNNFFWKHASAEVPGFTPNTYKQSSNVRDCCLTDSTVSRGS